MCGGGGPQHGVVVSEVVLLLAVLVDGCSLARLDGALDWHRFNAGAASPEQESLCVWCKSALSWIRYYSSLAA